MQLTLILKKKEDEKLHKFPFKHMCTCVCALWEFKAPDTTFCLEVAAISRSLVQKAFFAQRLFLSVPYEWVSFPLIGGSEEWNGTYSCLTMLPLEATDWLVVTENFDWLQWKELLFCEHVGTLSLKVFFLCIANWLVVLSSVQTPKRIERMSAHYSKALWEKFHC